MITPADGGVGRGCGSMSKLDKPIITARFVTRKDQSGDKEELNFGDR